MKQVLILGGGVAGLSAARTLREWDAFVHVVEKEDHLGGKVLEWACMATGECQNCGSCLSGDLVNDVEQLENIKIHLGGEINDIQREGKRFKVDVIGKNPCSISVDGIIITTGFDPFDPSSIASLNYPNNRNIVTTQELNKFIKLDNLTDLFEDKVAPRVAFIQCVGSRNREQGRDYCSQVCCKVALRQANKVLDQFPNAEISFYHMDLQIIGKEFRTRFDQIKDRVRLIQGVPAEILIDQEPGCLTLFHEKETDGQRVASHYDTVVLSIGMMSPGDSPALSRIFNIKTDQWGFFHGKEGHLADGIYSAGAARGPTDIMGVKQQGIIAAHDLARDLGLISADNKAPSATIIGDGHQGMRAAKILSSHGVHVTLLDMGKRDMESTDGVEYLPLARLRHVAGTLGQFKMEIEKEDEIRSMESDVIIVATEAERNPVPILGLDYKDRHLTGLSEFLGSVDSGSEELPERIAFMLDYSGEEWKVNVRNTVLAASSLAEQGKEIFIIIKKMLVNGLKGQLIYDRARQNGVRFLRLSGTPSFQHDKESLKITLKETTLGNVDITLECDLLVIPESILPSQENPRLGHILKTELDKEGFLQSGNTRHRLVSSTRKGIFFIGSCHDETDDLDLEHEIYEISALLDPGEKKNTRDRNEVALIDEKLCGRCLTCFRSCPHGAILLRDSFQPYVVPDACFGCGQCVSLCPAKAITQDESGVEDVEGEELASDAIVVYMCERSASLAEKEAKRLCLGLPDKARIIHVPCAGSVSIENILTPLLRGAGQVIIAGCHQGNCRSGRGGTLTSKQLGKIVKDTGISENELRYHSVAANEPVRLKRILSE